MTDATTRSSSAPAAPASPTAMLLARKGYRVLVVDRATFPSDTLSTHMIHAPGVAALQPLGAPRPGDRDRLPADRHLLVRLRAVHDHRHALGRPTASRRRTRRAARCSTRSSSTPPPPPAPRCARASPSRRSSSRTASVVGIRGHGHGRRVGRRARARRDRRRRPQLPRRQGRGARAVQREADAAVGLLHVLERPAGRRLRDHDPSRPRLGRAPDERRPDAARASAGPTPSRRRTRPTSRPTTSRPSSSRPQFAERVRGATREERFSGGSVPNFFRKPYGPGWALVGDAGYTKDPITAQGISDAFRDAELCAAALDDAFTGGRSFDDAMADYQHDPRRARAADLRVHDAARDARSRRRPRCSSCSAPCTATRTRWTRS